jgi:hypothetical protein
MTIAYPYYDDENSIEGFSAPKFVWVAIYGSYGADFNIITLPWKEMTVAEKEEWKTIDQLSDIERWNWANEVRGMMSIRAGH